MIGSDATFRPVLIGFSVVFFSIALFHRVRSARTGEPLDRRQEGWLILLTLRPLGLALIAGCVAWMIDPSLMSWSRMPLPHPLRWAGLPLGGLASALLLWTLHTLGPNLTDTVVTRREHTLVTSGPYRFVRHPFYGCTALGVLSASLLAANAFLLVTGGLVLALLVARTPIEEAALLARFGDEYRAYRDRTGRFLPRLRSTRDGDDQRAP